MNAAVGQERGRLPVGRPVDWSPRPVPETFSRTGAWSWIAPLTPEHDQALYRAWAPDPARFTYLPFGPFEGPNGLVAFLDRVRAGGSWLPFAIGRIRHEAEGMASLMRIDSDNGTVEIGGILYGAGLAGTPATTEAMYLIASHVFDVLEYRRYEWKCDSLNRASRRAAERLGFRYEGTWRNAVVYKGRNRDTAWYAMTDEDWPVVKRALVEWLRPENLVPGGQRRRLEEIREGPGTPL